MELIVAVDELAGPGARQAYALTAAEQLDRLGHHVTLFARRLGPGADLARARCLAVTAQVEELPERADGVIVAADRSLAIELAARFPGAARIFVVHGIDENHLPPPLDGVVAATIALDDRARVRATACAGAGEVVRLRQPVDIERFGAHGMPSERPRRALLLGDHLGAAGSRARLLEDAWSEAGIECEQVASREPRRGVAEAMREVDIVVGHGRFIVEAMAGARAAYVFDRAGGGEWVTPESYERIEAAGFSGTPVAAPPDGARLRADLDDYRPELGRLGHDLVRLHHDAHRHAAELVALLHRLLPAGAPAPEGSRRDEPAPLVGPGVARDEDRQETERWYERAQALDEQLGAIGAELERTRATLAEAAAQMQSIRESGRFRLAEALLAPVERLRRRARRRS